jgi:hypothetical protein
MRTLGTVSLRQTSTCTPMALFMVTAGRHQLTHHPHPILALAMPLLILKEAPGMHPFAHHPHPILLAFSMPLLTLTHNHHHPTTLMIAGFAHHHLQSFLPPVAQGSPIDAHSPSPSGAYLYIQPSNPGPTAPAPKKRRWATPSSGDEVEADLE